MALAAPKFSNTLELGTAVSTTKLPLRTFPNEALAAAGEHGLLELVMASHAGMTTLEF